MAITKITANILESGSALTNINAGSTINFTKNVSLSGNLTVDTDTLFVDSVNNRVGIGTASPTVPLEVVGNANFNGAATVTNGYFAITSPTDSYFKLRTNTDNKEGYVEVYNGKMHFQARSMPLYLSTNSSYTSPTMVVDTSGNVGIGTTSPNEKLTVVGNVSASGTATATNLVYNTGDQTIAGVKTFSNDIVGNGTSNRLPNQTSLTSDAIMTRSLIESFLMDNDVIYEADHFIGGGSFGSGQTNTQAGSMCWNFLSNNGTNAVRCGCASQVLGWYCNGDFTIQTGPNRRDGGSIYFNSNFAGGGPWLQGNFNNTTIIKVRFRKQSNVGLRIGLSNTPTAGTLNVARLLGLEAHPASSAWSGSTSYALGEYIRPTSANGRRYYASVAGTSGSSEPTWPTTAGGTVVDGTVTWKEDGRDGSTNFMFVSRDNADALTGIIADSGITQDTNWHILTIRCTNNSGTQWALSIDSGAEQTLTFSTATLTFAMQAYTHTAAQSYCAFDYFKFFQRGNP